MAPTIVQQQTHAALPAHDGAVPAQSIRLPPEIERSEREDCDEYRGPAAALIDVGLVRPDQLPPEGRFGISFLDGKPMRGNRRKNETYLRVERRDDETLRVYVGVPTAVAAARKAAATTSRRREWEAKDLQARSEAAKKAKRELDSTPKTKDEYRRRFAQQLRRWVQVLVQTEDKLSREHGFSMDRESMEAVLTASDSMIEQVMGAKVHFNAAQQAKVIDGYTSIIKAADPSFYAQLDKLVTPNASLVEGEAS